MAIPNVQPPPGMWTGPNVGATALNGPMMGGISVGDLLTDGNIITDMPTNAMGAQPQGATPTAPATTSTIPGLMALATSLGAPATQPVATPPAAPAPLPVPTAAVSAPVANATAGAVPVTTSVVGGGGSSFDAALGATIGGGGSDWTVVSPSGVPIAGDMTGGATGGGAGVPVTGSVVGGTGGGSVGGSVVGGSGKDWELVSTNTGGSVVGGATNPSALGGAAAAMPAVPPAAPTNPRIAPGATPMPATGGGPVAAVDREQAEATKALRAELAALRADRAGGTAGADDADPAAASTAPRAPAGVGDRTEATGGQNAPGGGDLLSAVREQATRGATGTDTAPGDAPDPGTTTAADATDGAPKPAADAPAPTPAPAPAVEEPKPEAPKTIDHKIADGETLSKIADQYKTDIATLQKLNDIPNPDLIIAGNVLKVPG